MHFVNLQYVFMNFIFIFRYITVFHIHYKKSINKLFIHVTKITFEFL